MVRERERLGLIWINQEQQKFRQAPAYLSVLTSRPIEEITSPQLRQRQKIGLQAVINSPDFTNERGAGADREYRAALYRLKAQEGLYLEDERGVTFLTPDISGPAFRFRQRHRPANTTWKSPSSPTP